MELQFYDYRESRPPNEGWYIWKLPHKFIENLTVIFIAKYRERGAGYERVLSPEFDYWNGYSILLPKGKIEWTYYAGGKPKSGHELLEIEELENLPCPFCNQIPKWKYSGRYITACPNDTDYFYLECCEWYSGFRKRAYNPRNLTEARNKAILKKGD